MFGFGKYAHERKLLKELRKPAPDLERLTELRDILNKQVQTLPSGLLWKAQEHAQKARLHLTPGSDLEICLRGIRQAALYEFQTRCRRMGP